MNQKLTATTHPVDFNHLSPLDFSRLCFWFVDDSGEYEKVEFYDGSGDKQRDVIGYVNSEEIHYYQCKRYKDINYSEIKKELELLKSHIDSKGIPKPARLYFVSSTEVSPSAKDKVKDLCQKLDLADLTFWGPVILDKKIKANPAALSNFFNLGDTNDENRPVVDIEGLIAYGTEGYTFDTVNNGETKAIDIKWSLQGFGFSYIGTPTVFSLTSGEKKELRINLKGDFMKKDPIKEFRLHFEYRDSNNKKYYSDRMLNIEKVNSGAFYRIAAEAGVFIPPQRQHEFNILNIDSLPRNGASYGYAVDYSYEGQSKTIEVFVSHTLIAIFGFSDKEVAHAVRELAENKIEKMINSSSFVSELNLNSYLLDEPLNGYEAYKYIRNKI